jgi:acyl-CoA thioesterase-2
MTADRTAHSRVSDLGTDYDSGGGDDGLGQVGVDSLVRLLDLERIEEDIFRGVSPKSDWQRVFGGQVAGQALVAAGRTVDPARHVHSLHSYFVRPGDPSVPIVYTVDRVRDGRSFSTRRVTAIQHGVAIFALSASFQLIQPGIEHESPMPEAPDPESLPTLQERYAATPQGAQFLRRMPQPIELRYVDDPPWGRTGASRPDGPHRVWMRATGRLPENDLLHVCVLTFASDLTLLDSILVRHGLTPGVTPIQVASLDHAMWFHRHFRADEWVLYSSESPAASGSRGLATGQFFSQSGHLLASVVQEGMIRVPIAGSSVAGD